MDNSEKIKMVLVRIRNHKSELIQLFNDANLGILEKDGLPVDLAIKNKMMVISALNSYLEALTNQNEML